MKTVLITGGTGFLGVYLSRYLIKKGYKVIALDIADPTATDLDGKITFTRADIRKKKDLVKAFKNVDYVVHAAAALPIVHARSEIFKTNIDGTRNVLEQSLKDKVKKLVFISSTAV